MTVIDQDKARFAGLTRGAEITERVQQDAALKAALAIEAESRAAQQRQAEARQAEAMTIAQVDDRTVERLAALKDLYQAREAAARVAIEAVSALWRVEQEIRDGLSDADRIASSVEYLIEETQRGPRRSGLRVRGGIPARHVFIAPRQWLTNDGLRAGAAAVAALTAGCLGPGFVRVRNESIDFDV